MLAILIPVALAQGTTAKVFIAEALAKLEQAKSITVTVLVTTEEFPKPYRLEYAYRQGGYLRIDDGHMVQVANPKAAWAFSPTEKKYRPIALLPKGASVVRLLSLDMGLPNLPILNGPTRVTWHGKRALRIELDGRKAMTKETKLFTYYDPNTHWPIGVSANLGSITQVRILEHMKVNQNLSDSMFAFTPPHGWSLSKG
jgi:outer membrane lipoprotein-sorting protein